jgi:hypothetical protein
VDNGAGVGRTRDTLWDECANRLRGSVAVQDQPSGGGSELPDELAPDADLRAARNEIRAVADGIRAALAADDIVAAGGQPTGDEANK